ncbi:unnamed protein product [Amoebophrya sp. A25]|nr:unnamed protein product [Amoebophrya sp. A25]|eukprot:GSA25T00021075001.1
MSPTKTSEQKRSWHSSGGGGSSSSSSSPSRASAGPTTPELVVSKSPLLEENANANGNGWNGKNEPPVFVQSFGQSVGQLRIATVFEKEPDSYVQRRKALGAWPPVSKIGSPIQSQMSQEKNILGQGLPCPLRPTTSNLLTKAELEANEESMFEQWSANVREQIATYLNDPRTEEEIAKDQGESTGTASRSAARTTGPPSATRKRSKRRTSGEGVLGEGEPSRIEAGGANHHFTKEAAGDTLDGHEAETQNNHVIVQPDGSTAPVVFPIKSSSLANPEAEIDQIEKEKPVTSSSSSSITTSSPKDPIDTILCNSLPPIEYGLDVWRQLWRTVEQSGVLIICADARNPLLHIPVDVAQIVQGKPTMLVLTKVDLVLPEEYRGWREYFLSRGEQHEHSSSSSPLKFDAVLPFTKQPHPDRESHINFVKTLGAGFRRKRLKQPAGKKSDMRTTVDAYVDDILDQAIELMSKNKKNMKENIDHHVDDHPQHKQADHGDDYHGKIADAPAVLGGSLSRKDKMVIGCIGHPNAGKSSLLNAIIGSKKLGVSRTAGHTKHIQHIYLPTTRGGGGGASPRGGGGLTPRRLNVQDKVVVERKKSDEQRVQKGSSPNVEQQAPTQLQASSTERGKGGRSKPRREILNEVQQTQTLSKSEMKAMKNELRTDYREKQRGVLTVSETKLKGGKNKNKRGGGGRGARGGEQNHEEKVEDGEPEDHEEEAGKNDRAPTTCRRRNSFPDEEEDADQKLMAHLQESENLDLLTHDEDHDQHDEDAHLPRTASTTEDLIVMDCPGLIFPRKNCPRFVYELAGLVPIAQIRESYSAIRFLASQLPLDRIYSLEFPDWAREEGGGQAGENDINEDTSRTSLSWTPALLLESYAEKKHYTLARSGSPDIHRAGLEIIRDCVDGVVCWRIPPPST